MKKWIFRILKTLGVLIVLAVLGVSGLFLYWKFSPDAAPLTSAELAAFTPHYEKFPDAQNGFLVLANCDVHLTNKEWSICQMPLIPVKHSRVPKWNQVKVDSLLASYAKAVT